PAAGGGGGESVAPSVNVTGALSAAPVSASGGVAPADLQTAWAATQPPVAGAPAVQAGGGAPQPAVAPAAQGGQAANATPAPPVATAPAGPVMLTTAFGPSALPFAPNVGQAGPQVLYLTHQAGMTAFLTAQGATFVAPVGGPAATPSHSASAA